ncbi:MAG: helix-turn-helix domain-containing protein [Pseudomonadota bacterium]
MPRPRSPKGAQAPVKSALRVLEVLEHFAAIERPASVSDLAKALNYPQSSTSMLVRTMIEQGYLAEAEERKVVPTDRVAMLGRWLDTRLSDTRLHKLMRDLSQRTGETILLGIPSDCNAIYAEAIPATNPMRLHIARGTTRPIEASGVGLMLLSAMDDAEIARRVARAAGLREEHQRVPLHAVMEEVEAIRRRGYSRSVDRIAPGAGIVCVLIPGTAPDNPVAIGIGGLSSLLLERTDELVALLRDRTAHHLSAPAAK